MFFSHSKNQSILNVNKNSVNTKGTEKGVRVTQTPVRCPKICADSDMCRVAVAVPTSRVESVLT